MQPTEIIRGFKIFREVLDRAAQRAMVADLRGVGGGGADVLTDDAIWPANAGADDVCRQVWLVFRPLGLSL